MPNILSDLKSLFSKRMDIIFQVCCRQFRANDEICNFKTSRLKNCLKKRACFYFSYELNDTLHPSQQTFGHVGMFHLRLTSTI